MDISALGWDFVYKPGHPYVHPGIPYRRDSFDGIVSRSSPMHVKSPSHTVGSDKQSLRGFEAFIGILRMVNFARKIARRPANCVHFDAQSTPFAKAPPIFGGKTPPHRSRDSYSGVPHTVPQNARQYIHIFKYTSK